MDMTQLKEKDCSQKSKKLLNLKGQAAQPALVCVNMVLCRGLTSFETHVESLDRMGQCAY